MKKRSVQDLAKILGANVLGAQQGEFQGVSTDSRQIKPGDLFFALVGEKFDAHQFLEKAFESGAKAMVLHRWDSRLVDLVGTLQFGRLSDFVSQQKLTVFVVPDTLRALQDLARHERREFKGPVVSITGSNGKTTTKEFTTTILSQSWRVHSAKGSFNNHVGLPLTLLSIPEDTEVVVLEMGMNHSGEIDSLCRVAEPTHTVVTMVGTAHIENLGSQDSIARAKEEIYLGTRRGGFQVFNLDNPWTISMYKRALERHQDWEKQFGKALEEHVFTFSSQDQPNSDGSHVYLTLKEMDLETMWVEGTIGDIPGQARVPVFGAQNLNNLMAASALALSLGMPPSRIWKGLENCRTIWGRNQLLKAPSGCAVLFDAYNSNPESMKGLLENFKRLPVGVRKFAVFAEMLELGTLSAQFHREMGALVAQAHFEAIYFYGPHAQDFAEGARSQGAMDRLLISEEFSESLAKQFVARLDSNSLLALKGSRGMKMERMLKFLNIEEEKG